MEQGDHIRFTDVRRRYLLDHPIAVVLGAYSALSGMVLLFGDVETSAAVAEVLEAPWFSIWCVFYSLGGAVMLLGMTRLQAHLEVAGCCLLAGSQVVNLYSIVLIRGGAGALASGASAAVAIGLVWRAAILTYRHRKRGR